MRSVLIVSAIVFLVHFMTGCATAPEAPAPSAQAASSASPPARAAARLMPPRPAVINHFVVFKLHDPEEVDELIADCDRYLARIPGVVSYFVGRHHDIGRGDRVFADYHVGLFVGFNTDDDYRAYVDHPDHIRVVQKWQLRLDRLRVYDVWDDGSRD